MPSIKSPKASEVAVPGAQPSLLGYRDLAVWAQQAYLPTLSRGMERNGRLTEPEVAVEWRGGLAPIGPALHALHAPFTHTRPAAHPAIHTSRPLPLLFPHPVLHPRGRAA